MMIPTAGPLFSRSTRVLAFAVLAGVALTAVAGDRKRLSYNSPAALYHNYCSVCHGDRGDGNSRAANGLNPPPKDFSVSANLGREHMIAVVRDGKPGTAMTGWSTQLTPQDIENVVDYVRLTFQSIATDPRLQRGLAIYRQTCANCHGDRGQGAVFPPAGVTTPPRDLTTPAVRKEINRERMLDAVTNGRSGTAMIAYKPHMAPADIEAVVDYVRAALMVPETNISGTSAHANAAAAPVKASGADMGQAFPNKLKGNVAAGKQFYNANCATCHGEKGDGQGPRAYFINPKPAIFTSEQARATLNRPTLYTFVAAGKLGTEMPAWRHVLTEQEMANVAEYVFQAFIAPGKQASAGK